MKTAIAQLIEYIDKTYGVNYAASDIKEKAKELEPVNEQQIKDAFDSGKMEGALHSMALSRNNGKQYFNETFKP